MISEKFNTETVAVYDYTIRKRKTEEMPQIKDGTAPLLPSQVSASSLSPVVKLEINKELGCWQQVHIDQTYWAAVGRVRLHLGEEATQRVLSGASIARICNVFGDHSLDQFMTALSQRQTLDHSTMNVTLGRYSQLVLAAERAKARWFAITLNNSGATSSK